MCKNAFPEVEGEAFRGVQWIDLDKIYPSVGLEALEIHRKHKGYARFPHPRAQGGLLCGVIPAGMCKRALPKVEGEAIGGLQWIDLDQI